MSYAIEIIDGHDPSSYYWFKPVLVKTSPKIILDDDIFEFEDEFSIEEGDIDCFLLYFFLKYFDSELDCNKNRYWYGIGYIREFGYYLTHNFYTYEVLKRMCNEIQQKAELLENNFEHSSLTELKESFSIYYMCNEHDPDFINKNCTPSAIKNHIRVVTNFYRRFVKRLTQMMVENPETDIISIMGP